MTFPDVNYLAVLVSGVAIFVLGGLWYSPALFAKKWMALIGKNEDELKAGSAGIMPMLYGLAFLCALATAWTLAVIQNHFDDLTILRATLLGGMCWFGFAGATSFATALFSMKPKQLWLIDSGYNLASFVMASIILSLWR
ncbi:MAG: DUF1761 domain-containing protein [Sulfuricaulis sp.]|nr:DUF1761 domain-containing protein [Sulfuricaulis sp.]